MKTLRVAVIGCGKVSHGHVAGWMTQPERARIVALADVVPKFCEELVEKFKLPGAAIRTDYRDILADPNVDAVDICTYSHLHSEQIVASLEAGKHIMTEKPVGYTMEDCRKLRWYAHKHAQIKVGVAYSLRYYPLNIEVRRLLREGAIGRVMYADATHNHPHDCSQVFDEPDPPYTRYVHTDRGGAYIAGSEMTHCTHIFDLMRYLFGEVRDVFAYREPYGTFALMRFRGGALAKATAGTASDKGVGNWNVLCVQGTQGTIVTRNEPGKGYHGFIARGKGIEPIAADTESSHGDRIRTKNFVEAVLDGAPLIAPFEDAIATSELLHAIRESHDMEIRVPVHGVDQTG